MNRSLVHRCATRPWQTAVLICCAALFGPRSAVGDDAWPWLKYEVELAITATDDAHLTERRRAEIGELVTCRLREVVGNAWNIRCAEVAPAVALEWAGEIDLLDGGRIARTTNAGIDKTFVIAIDADHGALKVRVREWDATFASLGPLIELTANDRELLPDVVAETVLEAFRAPARIVDVRQNDAQLSVRGALLFPPDALGRLVRRGDGFQPYLRLRNRDGRVVDSRPVPWTLLKVGDMATEAGLPIVECEITSGVRGALSASQRGRSERWALAVGRPRAGTWLKLVGARGGATAADCEAFRLLPERQFASLGKTDADGRVFVPPSEGGVETILVTSRYLPLARVPLVPGAIAVLEVPVGAGPGLRQTEDWLADWQSEFLDLYIRRRALLTAIGYRIERRELPVAEQLLTEVDRLPSPAERVQLLDVRRRETLSNFPTEARLLDGLFAEARRTVAPLDDAQALAELRDRLKAKN